MRLRNGEERLNELPAGFGLRGLRRLFMRLPVAPTNGCPRLIRSRVEPDTRINSATPSLIHSAAYNLLK